MDNNSLLSLLLKQVEILGDPGNPYTCDQWSNMGEDDTPVVSQYNNGDDLEQYNPFYETFDGFSVTIIDTYGYVIMRSHCGSPSSGIICPWEDQNGWSATNNMLPLGDFEAALQGYHIFGCLDDTCDNYNPDAYRDDGNCKNCGNGDSNDDYQWECPTEPEGFHVDGVWHPEYQGCQSMNCNGCYNSIQGCNFPPDYYTYSCKDCAADCNLF